MAFIQRVGSGGNPPTRAAKLCWKHGVRAPRRKIVRFVPDGSGFERQGDWVLSCGHIGSGRGAEIGKSQTCASCQVEKAEALEAAASASAPHDRR